jgi:hypothetical protein
MAQVVSRRLLTAKVQLRLQIHSCGFVWKFLPPPSPFFASSCQIFHQFFMYIIIRTWSSRLTGGGSTVRGLAQTITRIISDSWTGCNGVLRILLAQSMFQRRAAVCRIMILMLLQKG